LLLKWLFRCDWRGSRRGDGRWRWCGGCSRSKPSALAESLDKADESRLRKCLKIGYNEFGYENGWERGKVERGEERWG